MADIKMLLTQTTKGIEQVLRLDQIHPSMEVYEDSFYQTLKESLEEKGLLNPLVVVPVTVSKWKDMCVDNKDMLPPPEGVPNDDVVLQIRCGNNRYWAAKEMEYKLITITKCGSMKEASKMCKAQQREMKQWKEAGEW